MIVYIKNFKKKADEIQTFLKLINYKILLDIVRLIFFSQHSAIIKVIIRDNYFWKLKLYKYFPQFDHSRYTNFIERYINLHLAPSNCNLATKSNNYICISNIKKLISKICFFAKKMKQCQCLNKKGIQCKRSVSQRIGDNSSFCWQHQEYTSTLPFKSKITKTTNTTKNVKNVKTVKTVETVKTVKTLEKKKTEKVQPFPKLINYEILLNMDPVRLMFFSKHSEVIRGISEDNYFWKLKLDRDFPQFDHSRYNNFFERYKRVYRGRPEKFILDKLETKDIDLFNTPLCEAYVTNRNLMKLTKIIKNREPTCIRGDLILLEEFKCVMNDPSLIFDGEKLINMDTDGCNFVPPKEFKVPIEFPICYWNDLYRGKFYLDKSVMTINESNICVSDMYIYCPVIIRSTQYFILLDRNSYFRHPSPDYFISILNTACYGTCLTKISSLFRHISTSTPNPDNFIGIINILNNTCHRLPTDNIIVVLKSD